MPNCSTLIKEDTNQYIKIHKNIWIYIYNLYISHLLIPITRTVKCCQFSLKCFIFLAICVIILLSIFFTPGCFGTHLTAGLFIYSFSVFLPAYSWLYLPPHKAISVTSLIPFQNLINTRVPAFVNT